jgi:hypothetical protein
MNLSNGAEVIDYTELGEAGNGFRRNGVVIARWHGPHPYVVWTAYQVEDGTWDCEHGNYCESITEAVEHYNRRGGK